MQRKLELGCRAILQRRDHFFQKGYYVFKRIVLFLITNLAVLFVLNITMRLLGVDRMLAQSGGGLNLGALLVFAGVIAFGGALVSLAISKWSAKFMTGAKVIDAPRTEAEHWLVETVRRQAQQANIGMPEVAIYDAPDVNAFATGMNRNNALVAVSSGLLNGMTRDEAEAVLGHEITHVANGDMVTLALIQGVVNTFVIFLSRILRNLVDKVVFKTERGNGPAFWITSIVAELVLGILASVIVMWFSRRREFRADAGGASLPRLAKVIAALPSLNQVHPVSQLAWPVPALGLAGAE